MIILSYVFYTFCSNHFQIYFNRRSSIITFSIGFEILLQSNPNREILRIIISSRRNRFDFFLNSLVQSWTNLSREGFVLKVIAELDKITEFQLGSWEKALLLRLFLRFRIWASLDSISSNPRGISFRVSITSLLYWNPK